MKLNKYGKNSKSFTENTFSFYQYAFSTIIHKASDLDISNSAYYAIELIGKYHKILNPLIKLVHKDTKYSFTSATNTYYVYIGKIVWGKVSISIQKYPDENRIWIVYKYKTDGKEYIKHRNHEKMSSTHRSRKRNKNRYLYRKRKEN